MAYPKLLTAMNLVYYCMIFLTLCIFGCGNGDDDSFESKLDPDWQIQSSAFVEGGEIPQRFSCEGEDISPALSWADPPARTQSLALLMDDPDAGNFTHWILYNLSTELRKLDENIRQGPAVDELNGANQGKTDFSRDEVGYGGPCPPSGSRHRYRFRLFALDAKPNLLPEASRTDFLDAINDHIIAFAQLTGVFSR